MSEQIDKRILGVMLCPFGGATGRIGSHPPSLILPPAGDSKAPKPLKCKISEQIDNVCIDLKVYRLHSDTEDVGTR